MNRLHRSALARAGGQEVTHRHPYECVLLARRAPAREAPARQAPGGAPDPTPPAAAIPDKLVLLACPGEHSRKPQLGRLLAPLLPPQPRCLEVRCQAESGGEC